MKKRLCILVFIIFFGLSITILNAANPVSVNIQFTIINQATLSVSNLSGNPLVWAMSAIGTKTNLFADSYGNLGATRICFENNGNVVEDFQLKCTNTNSMASGIHLTMVTNTPVATNQIRIWGVFTVWTTNINKSDIVPSNALWTSYKTSNLSIFAEPGDPNGTGVLGYGVPLAGQESIKFAVQPYYVRPGAQGNITITVNALAH